MQVSEINTTAQLQLFEMLSYYVAIGPGQLFIVSCKSTLLLSCVHNEPLHVVTSMYHLLQ